MAEEKLLLEGIRVIDAASFIAGPAAATIMSDYGADVIKVGMSSGSICTTQREKATGRAPMTALMEVERARADYLKESGKYVSIIIDGGVSDAGSMIIALSIADAVMMGGLECR